MRSKFAIFAVFAALVLGALSFAGSTPTTVSAQAETETVTEKVDVCEPESGFVQFCVKGHFVTHETIQPDGDTQTTTNFKGCLSYTVGGSVLFEACGNGHQKEITREGELQVEGSNIKGEVTFVGETCTLHIRYLIANGELRAEKENFEGECETLPPLPL